MLAMAFLLGSWWYLHQWVFIEVEKKKKAVNWGAFGLPLEVRTQVECPLFVALSQ